MENCRRPMVIITVENYRNPNILTFSNSGCTFTIWFWFLANSSFMKAMLKIISVVKKLISQYPSLYNLVAFIPLWTPKIPLGTKTRNSWTFIVVLFRSDSDKFHNLEYHPEKRDLNTQIRLPLYKIQKQISTFQRFFLGLMPFKFSITTEHILFLVMTFLWILCLQKQEQVFII